MRLKTVLCIMAAVLLMGSSPWEGAGVIAPDGLLPATGYYVATNSFPANTVVDITNIETNKSTRAIVASTLDTPGLLAVVSRQVGDLIGMRPGSVGRIRMVQPSDPIAYTRFKESLAAGIPEYDSGNVLTEENYREEIYRDDTYTPSAVVAAVPPPPVQEPVPQQRAITGPSYILEPEWRERPEITDLYAFENVEFIAQPEPIYVEEVKEVEEIESYYVEEFEFIAELEPDYSDYVEEEILIVYEEYKEYEDYHYEIIKDIPEYITETSAEEVDKETFAKIDEELPREEVVKYIPEWEDALNEEPVRIVETPPSAEEQPELVIVPTEERPPENTIYGINPDDIIPSITQTPQPVEVIPEPAPAPTPTPVYDAGFSVPRIDHLDRDRYYVQIAALTEPGAVEIALVNPAITNYSPKVFIKDNMYRIVLGPLNQGESAAVLQRFKSIGFDRAFVTNWRLHE